MRHRYFDSPRPMNLAHRGASGESPENTLVAFRRALEQGATAIESDLQTTQDGVPILLHDSDLARTTDGAGPASALEFAAVQRLDAGHHFTPDGGLSYPFRGKGLRVPGLEETLEALTGVRLNLEIKLPDPDLVDRVLRIIADAGREELTLLTAETDEAMRTLRQRIRTGKVQVAVGASAGEVARFFEAMIAGGTPPAGPMALQIPREFGGRTLVTPESVAFAHAHGLQVHVWTINDAQEMSELLDMGVDGIVTDHPARLAAVVASR